MARHRDDRDPESRGDEAFHRGNLSRLEDDVGVDVVLSPQFIGELPQTGLAPERDERLCRGGGQPHAGPRRQPVSARNSQAQPLLVQPVPGEARRLGPRRRDGNIGLTVENALREPRVIGARMTGGGFGGSIVVLKRR